MMTTTPESESQKRLRLTLEADGRRGLFELIIRAIGETISGRYRVTDLLAVGRQSFVFVAIDQTANTEVVIKQPAFDYRRPINYSRNDVARGRGRLKREHKVLCASSTGHMPKVIALEKSPVIVPAAKSSAVLGGEELFLVEEYVRGATLSELGLSIWPAIAAPEREKSAAQIIRGFIEFFRSLEKIGWFYADLSASNLIVEKSGVLRVVDAGSAVAIKDGKVVARGYTPAFTTPRIYDALRNGREVPAGLPSVLPALAKVVHFALTKKEPLNGELPFLTLLGPLGYSEHCAVALRALLTLDEDPNGVPAAEEALAKWSESL